MLQRLGGTLTAPAAGDPEAIALRYVRQALPDVDVSTLQAPTSNTVSGVTMLRWPQAVDGIPSADSELRVNVTRDGRVLSVLGAPATQLPTDTTPTLTAGEAVRAVQDALGSFRTLPRTRGPAGATRRTTYDDGTSAALALLRDRLAWRVTYRESSTAVWDMFVDADSGKVLERVNLVKTASGLVWDNYPGAALGGAATSVNLDPWLTSTTQLLGPSVRAFSDLDDDNVADAGEQVVPGSYAFTSMAGTGCSAAKQCSWTGAGATWTTNRQQNAVQAFYFANRFRDHLAAAPIGFDGFQGADPVIVQTDDGAATGPDSNHVNNANMYTPPDGTSPVMQMYLWRGPSYRAVNGGDDASILYHEYTHGLSNRLIRDADGAGALNSAQAGAMGEGWSDWYAKDFLVQQFPALDNAGVDGDVHMGTYTDITPNTIRTRGLDCPVNGVAGCSGYTYGDFGEIANGPEVHYDGEIWAQTLWDLRKALGSPDAERLITQGMRLSPAEPSFLDERNAILAADTAAGGTFGDQIWAVFAARGMGYYASTTGSDDVSPVEDFSPPPGLAEPRGTIAGRITDTSGAPLPDAKVALGSLVAEADADGRYSLPGIPARAYANLIVTAPGHDRVLTPATVAANQTTTFDPVLRRNWAARTGGATVAGGGDLAPQGCGALAAIDQHAGTAWSAPRTGSKTMTITLPQTIDVDHFAVDPGEGCADSPDAAARAVTIETSPNNVTWTTAAAPSFAFGDRHRMNVVAPAVGKSGVRYVRVTINSTLTAGWDYMDMSEFAVYTDAPVVTPTPTPTPTPTASPQPTATPLPTVVPTPVPTVVPSPTPVAKPSFKLAASGKRSIRVTARCPKACAVTATLTVDAATARKLRTSKTLATVKRTLKAGSTAFTVKVSKKARFTKVTRIKATLTVRSGTVVERRRVTIRR